MKLFVLLLVLSLSCFARGVHVSIKTQIHTTVKTVKVPKTPHVKTVHEVYIPAKLVPARVSVDNKGKVHITKAHVTSASERKVIR